MTVANAHAKAWNSQGRLVIGYLPGPDLPADADAVCLRAAVEATFFDTCQIGTSSIGTDTYATETITWGAATACRLSVARGSAGSETPGAQADTTSTILRLSLDYLNAVASTSHVRIISRFGATLSTPDVFRTVGGPQFGPTAITLNLERLPAGGVG